ncbi:tyrosine-type recombinase/integrase [Urechidicola vernalis]|uniref:Site-specific integrase n=1 Tax=Urechidicola vernalis TaxID=3075600 RepID=A0ABU2Y7E6_9FLAO|nr:site-specific integrase [Urechidicola sp. P050]MDT0554119.1 site-specific integrase [Urechidicola sp. P050]
MPTLSELLIFDFQNEHVLEHDLLEKKNYSPPKIYNANGDLSKRWYVYFSYRNPTTGKLQRVKNIYGKANKFKTKEERLTVLTVYRKKLLQLLKKGYNPYADNSSLYNQSNQTPQVPKKVEIQPKKEVAIVIEQEPIMAIKEALEFGLQLKEKLVNPTTKRSYENKAKLFLKWLNENHPTLVTVDALDKKLMTNFLNSVLIKSSPRNRNNFRTELGSVLQVLEDNEIITENVFKKIPVLKTKPKRHKPYTEKKKNEIFSNLEKEDPILLFFIKFVAYGFMRPVEVCRVRVGDIDVVNRTVKFKAKNSDYKTKLIPQLLWDELPDLSKLDKDALLFTPNTIGGDWDAEVESRREHFTNRFRAIVKIPFKLGADYTMYSFRHTYTVKVYREFRKKYAPFEAKSRLMLITGHTSMSALEKYLRDIDAELPKDYSEMLES